jgi:hypothetical protein
MLGMTSKELLTRTSFENDVLGKRMDTTPDYRRLVVDEQSSSEMDG